MNYYLHVAPVWNGCRIDHWTCDHRRVGAVGRESNPQGRGLTPETAVKDYENLLIQAATNARQADLREACGL